MIDTAAILAATPAALPFTQMLGLRAAPGARHEKCRVFCPWHNEKHPSCDVGVRDGRLVAVCRSCGAGGDVFALAAASWGMDATREFQEVAKRLAEMLGVRLEEGPARVFVVPDPIAAIADRIDALADQWISGRAVNPLASDVAAIEAASEADRRAAMALLAARDAAATARDDAMAAMADDVLAECDRRHRAMLKGAA